MYLVKATGLSYASLDAAQAAANGGEIVHNNLPCFILTGLCSDDVMVNILHWHHEPTKEEVDEMIESTSGDYVCFYLSQVKSLYTPCPSA